MKTTNDLQPLVFFDQPIYYIDDYASVARIAKEMPDVLEFIVIGESGQKVPTEVTQLAKERNIKIVRIRASGSWNSLYRLMADVDVAKRKGQYVTDKELVFLSFHSAHDISSALKRHRAFAKLTCRELYYLAMIDNMDVTLETIENTVALMPNVPTTVLYSDLSVEQRFKLSAFEFSRFIRPVHCTESLELLFKAVPFYENNKVMMTEVEKYGVHPVTEELAASA